MDWRVRVRARQRVRRAIQAWDRHAPRAPRLRAGPGHAMTQAMLWRAGRARGPDPELKGRDRLWCIIRSQAMLYYRPCRVPGHAVSQAMQCPRPCYVPGHAMSQAMLYPRPCYVSSHAMSQGMLCPRACYVPGQAISQAMLCLFPRACYVPDHAMAPPRAGILRGPCYGVARPSAACPCDDSDTDSASDSDSGAVIRMMRTRIVTWTQW